MKHFVAIVFVKSAIQTNSAENSGLFPFFNRKNLAEIVSFSIVTRCLIHISGVPCPDVLGPTRLHLPFRVISLDKNQPTPNELDGGPVTVPCPR